MEFLILFFILIGCMQVYFSVAARYRIIDKPNERSSHALPTIRGGGIIFLVALIIWFFADGFTFPYLVTGTLLIGMISLLDDVKTRPALLRLIIHILAFLLIGIEVSLFLNTPWWIVLLIFIIGIGTLNAFNFMDGINGMTGIYALVTLLTLLIIDQQLIDFTNDRLILILIVSVLVFLVYNFRIRARCFAGDVGSLTLAFLLIFLLLQLMTSTGQYGWFVLFGIYCVDTVSTIIYRLVNRENIFKAHRSHLYQYMANELKFSHLSISLVYGILQLIVNILIIAFLPGPSFIEGVLIVLGIALIYACIRERVLFRLGRRGLLFYLFNFYNSKEG